MSGWYQRRGKRALDVVGATAMGIVAAPLAAAAAAALWKTQGRPILFTQIRIGMGEQDFTIYKFRTMVMDAAAQGAGMWFDRDDPRVTPVGRFLRASSIDELPQIWNVLRGDMSLVGPRPKPHEITDRYHSHYEETLQVRPGLTCLAAIEGRNTLKRSQMIDADQRYVRSVSFLGRSPDPGADRAGGAAAQRLPRRRRERGVHRGRPARPGSGVSDGWLDLDGVRAGVGARGAGTTRICVPSICTPRRRSRRASRRRSPTATCCTRSWCEISATAAATSPARTVRAGRSAPVAWREPFLEACRERGVVSEFIRFHPVLRNHTGSTGCG